MIFSSPEYIFVFLPAVFLVYWTVGRTFSSVFRTLLLLVASLFFYAWWHPKYLVLLLGSVLVNFALGRLLRKRPTRWILVVSILLNCAPLAFYKYTDFLLSSVVIALGWFDVKLCWTPLGLVLPLGISFFTFQQIAYLVDCWRGGGEEVSLPQVCALRNILASVNCGPYRSA